MKPNRRALFLSLAFVALAAVILYRPLSRGEIAYGVDAALNLEPWASFPEFVAASREIRQRSFGAVLTPWDPEAQFYPWHLFARSELEQGRVPLWFPFAHCGNPFVAKQQSAVFDVGKVLLYLWHSPHAYNVLALFKLFLVGFFTYLFARRAGLKERGAAFSALLACLAPYLYYWWSHPHSMAAAFLPALLWATLSYLEDNDGRALLSVSAISALSLLAGHSETSIHSYLCAGLFAASRLYFDAGIGPGEKIKRLAVYTAAGMSGALLGAAHLFPAQEYMSEGWAKVWRSRPEVSWEIMGNITRPLASGDIAPMCAAWFFAILGAWGAWQFTRQWRAGSRGREWGPAFCGALAALASSVSLFISLGIDEGFLHQFLPDWTNNPQGLYAYIGMMPLSLALLGLLAPGLSLSLKALLLPALFAAAAAFKFPGVSHALGSMPFLEMVFHHRLHFVLPFLACHWAGYGLDRLLEISREPYRARLKESSLTLMIAGLAAGSVLWGYQGRGIAETVFGKGLHSEGLFDRERPWLGGLSGAGKQTVLSGTYSFSGWLDSETPVVSAWVGFHKKKAPVEAALKSSSGKIRFHADVLVDSGVPLVYLKMRSGGVKVLRGSEVGWTPFLGLKRPALLLALTLIVLGLAMVPLPSAWTTGAVILLSMADLLGLNRRYLPSVPAEAFLPSNSVVEKIASDAGLFRTFAPTKSGLFRPAGSAAFRIQDLRADDFIDTLGFTYFSHLADHFLRSQDLRLQGVGYDLLDLANVKYHYMPADQPLPKNRFDLMFESSTLKVYKSRRTMPRAFFAPKAELAPQGIIPPADLLEFQRNIDSLVPLKNSLAAAPFDFSHKILLEKMPLPSAEPPARKADARVASYAAGRVEIDVEADGAGYLFLSDAYFPGWKASVDGRDSEILRAWFHFRAVALTAGRHRVVFEYRPVWFYRGVWVSVMAILVWLVLMYRLKSLRPAPGDIGHQVMAGLLILDVCYWLSWWIRN